MSLPVLPAQADDGAPVTATPPVTKANWYWNEKHAVVAGNGLPALPDAANALANVPAGALGVGVINDAVAANDKVAALGFDLTTIPVGSTFTRFTVTAPLDKAGIQVKTTQPDVSACENIDVFEDGPGAVDIAKAPPISAPSCVPGVFDAVKGYTFDITAIANDWSGGAPSEGITLAPTVIPGGPKPFSLVFQGKNGVTTSVAYTLPPADEVPAVPVVAEPQQPDPTAVGPVLQPSVPELTAPQAPSPVQLPTPQVNRAPTSRVVTLRSQGYVAPTTVPTTFWWLAILAGLVGLGVVRVVLADPMAPQPVDPRSRRFADVRSL